MPTVSVKPCDAAASRLQQDDGRDVAAGCGTNPPARVNLPGGFAFAFHVVEEFSDLNWGAVG